MAHLQASGVVFGYATQPIVRDLTWRIDPGRRYGLVGRNGTGKTTVLGLLEGTQAPDEGQVVRARGLRLAVLRQGAQDLPPGTLFDAMLGPFAALRELHDALQAAEARLAAGSASDSEMEAYGDLQQRYERLGGYSYESRIRDVLDGLGFPGADLAKPTQVLSGGERNRAALARVLLADPECLLLDEPTDHLDIEGTEWLETFLAGFPGSVVAVSHDRRFLDRICTDIAELELTRVAFFLGGYTGYAAEKARRLEQEQRAYDLQQAEIARQEDFIRRHIAGQKTRQAQSRRHLLGRLERLEKPTSDRHRLALRFDSAGRAGREVLRLEGVSYRIDERLVLPPLDLTLERGERVALVGPNGSGKTTLLRLLAGRLELQSGQIELGHNVRVAFYDQTDRGLDPARTVLDELWDAYPQVEPGQIRSHLARFLFRGETVLRRVGELSGGEQVRLALARMVLEPANLLVLDEPTNHLDIPAREVLEEALAGYAGTVLLVSHDRALLDRVAGRIWYLRGGRFEDFPGPYAAFREYQAQRAQTAPVRSTGPGAGADLSGAGGGSAAERRASKRHLRRERAEQRARRSASPAVLEREIYALEEEMAGLRAEEARPEYRSDWQKLAELHQAKSRLAARIEDLMERWEAALEDE